MRVALQLQGRTFNKEEAQHANEKEGRHQEESSKEEITARNRQTAAFASRRPFSFWAQRLLGRSGPHHG
jgi:hypothetical protein